MSSFLLLLSSVFVCAKRERLSIASWVSTFPPFISLTCFKMASVMQARAVMPLTIDVCTFWNFKSCNLMVELWLSQIKLELSLNLHSFPAAGICLSCLTRWRRFSRLPTWVCLVRGSTVYCCVSHPGDPLTHIPLKGLCHGQWLGHLGKTLFHRFLQSTDLNACHVFIMLKGVNYDIFPVFM